MYESGVSTKGDRVRAVDDAPEGTILSVRGQRIHVECDRHAGLAIYDGWYVRDERVPHSDTERRLWQCSVWLRVTQTQEPRVPAFMPRDTLRPPPTLRARPLTALAETQAPINTNSQSGACVTGSSDVDMVSPASTNTSLRGLSVRTMVRSLQPR